jgi:protein-disulfide isomerase
MLAMVAPSAWADVGQDLSIKGDDGEPIESLPVPSASDPSTLPGILWRGGKSADLTLYEFFDYDCGFCRKAALELDAILKADSKIRLGLINNPILSVGSVQAAKVEQAVLQLYGPERAYDFHVRLFAKRGRSDGLDALEIVKSIGLDARKVENLGDSSLVSEQLSLQSRFASKLDLLMTPSFIVAGVVILGWPGKKSFQSIIANARRCNRPICK